MGSNSLKQLRKLLLLLPLLALGSCSDGSVLPQGRGLITLKCDIQTSPYPGSKPTTVEFSINESNNTASIKLLKGPQAIQPSFSQDEVKLTLKEMNAAGAAIRDSGTVFGGTRYGGSGWGEPSVVSTYLINRETGKISYDQTIQGWRKKQKTAYGTCRR